MIIRFPRDPSACDPSRDFFSTLGFTPRAYAASSWAKAWFAQQDVRPFCGHDLDLDQPARLRSEIGVGAVTARRRLAGLVT